MGYTSIMKGEPFRANYTVEQLNDMYLDYLNTLGGVWHMEYEFEYSDKCLKDPPLGSADIQPIGLYESYRKNYNTDELACFIAYVCNNQCTLFFDGEDGEAWGYYIYPGKVYEKICIPGIQIYENRENPNFVEEFIPTRADYSQHNEI